MTLSGKFIPLDRRFAELSGSVNAEEAEDLALRSYVGRSVGVSSDFGWQDIYDNGRSCVVLGEAGSGKSREMGQQARNLRAMGIAAAHCDLADLLRSTSSLDQDAMLLSWRRSEAIAWFLLDSVDEAKLARVDDFHSALKRMAAWVGADSGRARYVISSRISEWRPATDKRLVEETLLMSGHATRATGVTEPRRSPDSPGGNVGVASACVDSAAGATAAVQDLRVLTLLPLTEEQARRYLAGRGSVDERFFQDVTESDAWDFLHRPLDVTNLHALWQKRGRLGTLREVVEHSVTELLSDANRPTSIAVEKVREGAEHVAACFTFGKSVSALVPDAVLPDASDALRLRTCVPRSWADAEVEVLAQLPIFDAAAYGKIRFHHRSYQAYLAASWVARLMRTDCPQEELRHLLFEQGARGLLTLRPSLASVAAWLACFAVGDAPWQEKHRNDLLRSAPWVYFAHGDPRSLPVQYKVRILRQTVEHFRGREHVHLDWDRETLKRFADPGLAVDLAQVIADDNLGTDLRADYVMIVRCGRLIDALPSVVAVAMDASAHEYLRSVALICLAEIGGAAHRSEVLAAFESYEEISPRLAVQLVQMAYPLVADERGLFALLLRMRADPGESRPSSLYDLDRFIEKGVEIERVQPLLEGLCSFVRSDEGKPIEARAWTGKWLAPLATRLLQTPRLEPAACRVVLESCLLVEQLRERHWLESWQVDDDFNALSEATTHHLQLRREWYWLRLQQFRVAGGKEPWSLRNLDAYYSPLSCQPCDMDWLVEDVVVRSALVDRQFAFRAALALSRTKAGKRPLLPPLSLVLTGIAMAETRGELIAYLRTTLSIPWHELRQKWEWNWRRSHWWRRRFEPFRLRYWNAHNRAHLWWRRADLTRGRWWNGTWFVMQRARTKRSVSQWGSHDLAEPIANYGMTVVQATMAGADRLWRQHRPELPHEKPERNETSAKTILGLVALDRAWQTDGEPYFHALSLEEADAAARYALNELNGLPGWFTALASAHASRVAHVIAQALEGDWRVTPAGNQFSSPTLQRLVHGPALVADLAASTLRTLLEGPPPQNAFLLRDAIRLALRDGEDTRAFLAARAAAQLDKGKLVDEIDWLWLTCLFLTDADRGLQIVERHFTALDTTLHDDAAVALCARLHDDFHGGLSCAAPDFERPAFLRRFIPWVHRYVRLADDAVHEGAYSPNARDHAERFRGSLLGRLQARDDDEADAALAELAADPRLADIRDFVLARIDQRKAARSDEYFIEPADLEALLARHERAPRSRPDLFHIARSRLERFKEEVESAENSIRHECGPNWRESDYQDWLQRYLRATARGLYTIPSEAKVDPQRFPDLRFEAPGVVKACVTPALTRRRSRYPSASGQVLHKPRGRKPRRAPRWPLSAAAMAIEWRWCCDPAARGASSRPH